MLFKFLSGSRHKTKALLRSGGPLLCWLQLFLSNLPNWKMRKVKTQRIKFYLKLAKFRPEPTGIVTKVYPITMHYFCELNWEPAVSHLQELPRPSPPRTTRSWSRFAVLKATSPTLFHLLRARQRRASSLPFYWRRKNAKSGLHTLCGYKAQNTLPEASSPTRRFWPLVPSPGFVKKKKKPKCPRPSAAERSREHLPFWNLLSLRPLCRVGTPGPFVGFSWLRPPRLSHLTLPSSFSYLRSLLEHLGKARGLGDVERHDQSAGSRSRALAEDPGGSEKRAQLPGNVACGRLTLLLSLQPNPPFPRRPSLWSLARRSSSRRQNWIDDSRSGRWMGRLDRAGPSVFRPTHA